MIERRVKGVANFYMAILLAAGVVAWFLLEPAVASLRGTDSARLLSPLAYVIAIVAGILFAWQPVRTLGPNLMYLDWAGAMALAMRQTMGIAATTFSIIVILKDPGLSRVFLAYYLTTIAMLFTVFNRSIPRLLARTIFHHKYRARTVFAGHQSQLAHFEHWLERQRHYGTDAVGFVEFPSGIQQKSKPKSETDLPIFESLDDALSSGDPDQIIVLSTDQTVDDVRRLLNRAHQFGCRVYLYNDYAERLGVDVHPVTFDGQSFLAVGDEPLEDPVNRTMKRLLDLILAVPLAILLLPPLTILVAIGQQLQSPGAVFFRQIRSGRREESFTIFKYRTMHASRQPHGPGEKKTFPFGSFLRRTSLDEIPQLLNVIRGEMSLVGPRPHVCEDDESFSETVSIYRMRFFVKPGITGLAQSRGLRGDSSDPEALANRIAMDLAYIRNWTIWLDIAIIARTLREIILPPPSAQ